MQKYIERSNSETLIEDIYKFKKERAQELSMMELLIEYSFQHDIPLQELGNNISDHKIFTNMLEKELAREKYIRLDDCDEGNFNEEEW